MVSNNKNIKDLSVIIVNYKSEHYLENCLSSLYGTIKQEIKAEIIIVNNYPQETLEKIKALFPEIKIINNDKNGGYGQGNNIGAREALGEYLLFLNPDTEIIEGSLTDVIGEFKNNPELGVVGSCLMTAENKIQKWSAGREVIFLDLIRNNLGFVASRKIWESDKGIEADWVAGTALFISKGLFLKLGGFDENIFMYFEDVDLCKRVRAENKKVFYFPKFKVFHNCDGSYDIENKGNQKNNYYDSMVYYFKKHQPKLEVILVSAIRNIFFKK